jgi:hypothetical protein
MPVGMPPPTRFSASEIWLKRVARRLFWPHPILYYPFGKLRKRGNVLDKRIELYISGYPRSGNSFARTAFLSANPAVRLRSHRHIPTFVLHSQRCGIPGIVLIRSPLDAAVSWAIHENASMEETIAYWNDYYQTLLPARSELFVARFKEVTSDFGGVIEAFNERWGTRYVPFEHTVENAARCFQVAEDDKRQPSGEVREMQVSRPSRKRRAIKEKHLERLNESKFLRNELARANELYETFVGR